MKRNRLIAGAVCAAVAGTLTLTACSSGGDGGSDGGDKEITFMFRGGADEKAAYEAAIKKYTADTGVKVKVIVTDADQYATKLQAAVAGNNVPDVFYIEQASLQSYVSSGVLMDITERSRPAASTWTTSGRTASTPTGSTARSRARPEGKLYGLPKDVGPFSFGYNKTMLEAAGIPLPDKDTPLTWDSSSTSASSSPSTPTATAPSTSGAPGSTSSGTCSRWSGATAATGPTRTAPRSPWTPRSSPTRCRSSLTSPTSTRSRRPPPTPRRSTRTSAGWPARSASSPSARGTSRSTTTSTSTTT